MRREAGQATVEWVGLLLVAALALGALGAAVARGRAPARDRELGVALAQRVRCAAAASCVGGAAGPARVASPRRRALEARRLDALRVLRGAGAVTRQLWIVCMGWSRYVLERDHPRGPNEVIALDEALDIVDRCFNPLGFLQGG